MAIHATERQANVAARLYGAAASWTLAGTPAVVIDGQERTHGDTAAFVRFSMEPLPGIPNGRASATQTSIERAILFIADLYWPQADTDAYAIERAADDLEYNLTLINLAFKDYSIPAAPTTVDGFVLFSTAAPTRTKIPSVNQYDRRRVTAAIRWFTAHS